MYGVLFGDCICLIDYFFVVMLGFGLLEDFGVEMHVIDVGFGGDSEMI